VEGVIIDDPRLDATADWGDDALPPPPHDAVRGYLAGDDRFASRRAALALLLKRLEQRSEIRCRLSEKAVDDEDWAESWKAYFWPTKLGRRIVVTPTWRDYAPAPEDLVIEIDPGMAFGTGQHPTTRLCLEALESRLRPGQEAPGRAPTQTRVAGPRLGSPRWVLDVGTGSGILAIAAALLGATRVIALDVDPVAVGVARENVALNGVEGRVQVVEGSLGASGPLPGVDAARFDMVLANVSSVGISEMAPALARALTPGGVLIASGIGDASADVCRDALERAGLSVLDQARRDGWCALTCAAP